MKPCLSALHRFALFGLIAAVIATSAAACTPAQPAPAADLVIAAPRGIPATAAQAAASAYQKQTGVRVRVEPLSAEGWEDSLSSGLLSGSGRYDLVYLPASSLAKWVSYHALQPLQIPLAGAAVSGPWLPPLTVNGQLYGAPVQPDALVLWYRADLLQGAGLPLPTDWPSLAAAARALNHPPEQYGLALAGNDMESAEPFNAVLTGFGGQAFDPDHQPALGEAPARQALAFYAALRTVDQVTPPGVEDFTTLNVVQALADGKAALGIAPLSAAETFADCKASPKVCSPASPPAPLLALTWLPGLPKTTAAGSLSAFAIPLHAAHADQAQTFATFLLSEPGAQAWAAGGGIPAHRAALETAAKPHPGFSELAAVTVYQLTVPPLVSGEQVLKAYNGAVHLALSGQKTPDQALDQAVSEIRKALQQGGE